MQIYPMRAVYSALCFAAVPFVYIATAYIYPDAAAVLGTACWITGAALLLMIVNFEVWDFPGRRL